MKYNRRGESTGRDQHPTAGMKAGGRGRGGKHACTGTLCFVYLPLPTAPRAKDSSKSNVTVSQGKNKQAYASFSVSMEGENPDRVVGLADK